jgi:hypothetical protein
VRVRLFSALQDVRERREGAEAFSRSNFREYCVCYLLKLPRPFGRVIPKRPCSRILRQ